MQIIIGIMEFLVFLALMNPIHANADRVHSPALAPIIQVISHSLSSDYYKECSN